MQTVIKPAENSTKKCDKFDLYFWIPPFSKSTVMRFHVNDLSENALYEPAMFGNVSLNNELVFLSTDRIFRR